MNLHKDRDRTKLFDGLSLALIVLGLGVFWFVFYRGGIWQIVGALFGIGAILVIYGVLFAPHKFKVTRYREKLVHEPGACVRLVFLSDLHAGPRRNKAWFERLAIETQALDPDILVFGGDYVAYQIDPLKDLEPLSKVHGHLGRYFVLGNHDFLDDPTAIRRRFRDWGITDLTNAHVTLQKAGHSLQLSGLDDHWYGRPLVPPVRVSKSLPHVTIAHEPDAVMDFSGGDTDLILSGHTHGGQIRLPFVGAITPIPAKLGRAVDCGRKLINGVEVIISRGCGESDLHARLFCPPEIVVIEVGI